MKIFTIIILLLCINYNAQYSSVWHNTDNDLQNNSIKDIVKDKYGFLWLSTENGVVKYDGNNFISYNKLSVKNMHFDNFYGNIKKDSIIAWNDNLEDEIVINRRKIKINKSSSLFNTSISIDNKVFRYYNKTQEIRAHINYYIQFLSGTYFFYKNHIEYIDNQTKKKTKIELNFSIKNIVNVFAHGETLFIINPKSSGIYKIEKGKYTTIKDSGIYNDPKSKLFWSQMNDQAFIINDNNIYSSRYENGILKTKLILHYNDIGYYPLHSIYFDEKYRNLYLGTKTKGLNILKVSDFFVAKQNIPFADEAYNVFLPYGNDKIITDAGLIFNKNGLVEDKKLENSPDDITMTYDDSFNIIYRKDFRFKRRFRNSDYQKNDSIVFTDEIHRIIKTNGKYIIVFMNALKKYNTVCFFENDQFKKKTTQYRFNTFINSVKYYRDNTYLMGGSKGLYMVSLATNKISKINNEVSVKQILKTRDGNFWISTQNNGLYLFKKNKLIKMPSDHLGFLSSAHYFLEDKFGYLWISSNNGLYKVLKDKLLEYADNPNTIINYYRYDKIDGFKDNEFNGRSAPNANILKNGEFVFPSIEGFVFFNPEKVKSYYPDPQSMYVERAKIDNSEIVLPTNDFNLKSGYKDAEIYIDVPYYANSANLFIQSKLLGSENSDWKRIDNNKCSLNDLSPGKYTLGIRMLISSDGRFVYKTVNIIIEPKFYETFLFKILLITILILIIFFIVRARTNLLQKIVTQQDGELKQTSLHLEKTQETLKNETEYQKKIIETISHDIATPIKHLSNMSKNLYETDDIELHRKYFDSIYKSSEELYKFTLGLKEYSNLYRKKKSYEVDEYSIFELIETKKQLFQQPAFLNQTEIYNNADQNITTNIDKNTLAVIIHNLLDNAVKNTHDGKIIIETESENGNTIIRITDSGIGISQEQINYYTKLFHHFHEEEFSLKKYGLGLHLVLHFVRKIDAQISFNINKPKGTIVEIKL